MKISAISANDLDDSLIARWKELQKLDPTLNRPFYHPEFTRLVSTVRPEVRIAVIESAGEISAFLPFEIGSKKNICQVGLALNDYHGLIGNLLDELPMHEVLRAVGARYWHFDHMPLAQKSLSPYVSIFSTSPFMQLDGGLEQYHQRLAVFQKVKTPGVIASMRKATNRLQRDHGPLRFEWNERSQDVMNKMMAFKSAQWRRTAGASHDAFSQPWVINLLKNGHALTNHDFCGTLSSLHAGDKLVASHFGFRAGGVLHGSFASFDPELSYYMPGSLLIHQFAEHGPRNGVSLFDMGRGTQDYKMRFATNTVSMGEGAISRPQFFANAELLLKGINIATKRKLKSIPFIMKIRSKFN